MSSSFNNNNNDPTHHHQLYIDTTNAQQQHHHLPPSNYPPHRHQIMDYDSSPSSSNPSSPLALVNSHSHHPPLPRYTSTNQQQQPRHQQPRSHPLSHATYADSVTTPTTLSDTNTPNGMTTTTTNSLSNRSNDRAIHPIIDHDPSNPMMNNPSSSEYSLSARSAANAYSNSIHRREIVHHSPLARLHRAWNGAAIGDSGKDERHVKKKRLGYLDGLKFLSALVVLNGTLFDAVLTDEDYKPIQRGSPLYIFRSTNLGISMLLLLSGRCLIAPLWDAPNPQSKLINKNLDPNKPLISWPRLTRAMLIRPFRFLFPVIAIAALQWGVASGGDNRATKNCNNAGMTEPYWANIDRFAGFVTLLFDLFTYFESDTIAGKAFGANLWTVPWFFQSSYAVYVTHFMLGNLPSNRYWVYGLLMFFSWTSLNYFALPITGLFIADMAAHGQTARLRKLPMGIKLAIRLSLVALALCTQWVSVVRNNLNSAMATINVQSHKEITFADWIFVTVILVIVETSEIAQLILSNIVFRVLSRLTAGIYLLAPAIVFTIVPDVALQLHDTKTYQASGVLGLSWLLLLGTALGGAVAFYIFVECPSKLLGEALIDWIEGMGLDKELMKKDAEDLKALGGK